MDLQFQIRYARRLVGRNEKTAMENYATICTRYGDNAMDFAEFEFWYCRFRNNEKELNIDRDLVPKARFGNMPVHIIPAIVQHLNFKDQTLVRKVSHGLRTTVNDTIVGRKTLDVEIEAARATLSFNGFMFIYTKENRPGKPNMLVVNVKQTIPTPGKDMENYTKRKEDCGLMETVISDMTSTIMIPNLWLEKLQLRISSDLDKAYFKLFDCLKRLSHLIRVTNLVINVTNQHQVMDMLRFLDPVDIEEICLFNPNPFSNNRFSLCNLIKTQHWHAARKIEIMGLMIDLDKYAPLLKHTVKCQYYVYNVTQKAIDILRDGFLKSVEFHYCNLYLMESFELKLTTTRYNMPGKPGNFLEIGATPIMITFRNDGYQ